MRLVIVDDSATNLVLLRSISSKIGGTVIHCFADSERAIEHLMQHDVDVIVVDYSMPRITGVELVKRMRSSPRHASTPILMVTGSSERVVHERAFAVGVNRILTKPVKSGEYQAAVEALAIQHAREAAA